MTDTNVSYCKGCGAEIEWRQVTTKNGIRFLPFNKGTNISHFTTCPNANEFRSNVNPKPVEVRHEGLEKWM